MKNKTKQTLYIKTHIKHLFLHPRTHSRIPMPSLTILTPKPLTDYNKRHNTSLRITNQRFPPLPFPHTPTSTATGRPPPAPAAGETGVGVAMALKS